MFDFQPEQIVASKIIPGVTFTILGPSYHRRIQFDKAVAEFRSLARLTNKRVMAIDAMLTADKAQFDKTQAEHLKNLRAAIDEEQDGEVRASLEAEFAIASALVFEIPEDVTDELEELNNKSIRQLSELHNAPRVRIYCKSINGLSIAGQPATVKSLLEEGPVPLVHEILQAIQATADSQAADLKNLQLPSISNSREDGKTNDTTASNAGAPDGTATETAASSQPS